MQKSRNTLVLLLGVVVLCGVSWALVQTWRMLEVEREKHVVVPLEKQAEGRKDQPVFAIHDAGSKKYGFINRYNDVLISPQYENAGDFKDGLAEVKLDGRIGFINEHGKMACTAPAGTTLVWDNAEGMIWYGPNGILGLSMQPAKWGLMDSKGAIVIKPTYPQVRPFSGGLAAVNVGAKWEYGFWTGGKWGYVNKQGAMVIPVQYNYANDFSDGLANVSDSSGTRFIDASGKTVIALVKGFAGDFREGLCPVRDSLENGEDHRTRYIDLQGKTVFTINGWGEEFHEGLAVLMVKTHVTLESKVYGFIDKTGKTVIAPQYGEAFPFSEGLAAVRDKKTSVYGMGDNWGFIDKTGKLRIKAEYNEVHSFSNGLSRVHLGGNMQHVSHQPPYWKGGEWWIIDMTGKKLHRCFDLEARGFP